jgi:hypothetical protein
MTLSTEPHRHATPAPLIFATARAGRAGTMGARHWRWVRRRARWVLGTMLMSVWIILATLPLLALLLSWWFGL